MRSRRLRRGGIHSMNRTGRGWSGPAEELFGLWKLNRLFNDRQIVLNDAVQPVTITGCRVLLARSDGIRRGASGGEQHGDRRQRSQPADNADRNRGRIPRSFLLRNNLRPAGHQLRRTGVLFQGTQRSQWICFR
jgi:hypothetical protein